MDEIFSLVAERLSYRKRARLLERISGSREEEYDIINHILTHSIRGTFALLLFPSTMIQITPYGTSYSRALSGRDSEIDNYLTIHPQLDEKYLRRAFTSFEFVLFKLCHIRYENLKSEYMWETEKTRTRFKKILSELPSRMPVNARTLFDELWYVRDAFSHSFIDIDEIKYRGIKLRDCFGQTWTGGSHDRAEFSFVQDLNELYDPIIELFVECQTQQLDAIKFSALSDEVIRDRTLGR